MIEQNQKAWDQKVKTGAAYTHPVSSEAIQKAKEGDWSIHITVDRPVPKHWFPSSLHNVKILCLASGGGQQGPILAAAGADVTVFDLSDNQLAQDRYVAERDGLVLKTIQGEMSNLSSFMNESFDLIVHPVSNVFVEDIQPVWQECARVLKKGGSLSRDSHIRFYMCLMMRKKSGEGSRYGIRSRQIPLRTFQKSRRTAG
ncbi:methyltransferase [Geomicrobium sp. JCM 19039]|nr:methyltransferase [Geomicrobium sp. JCM 19039]